MPVNCRNYIYCAVTFNKILFDVYDSYVGIPRKKISSLSIFILAILSKLKLNIKVSNNI